jgi:hypothetical protein
MSPSMTRRHACVLLAAAAAAAAAARPDSPIAAQSPAPRVVKVVGDRHQLALKSDGTVVGWGAWWKGQLGPVAAIGRYRR